MIQIDITQHFKVLKITMHIEGLRFKDKKAVILNQKILVAEHCQESNLPVFCARFPSPGAIPKTRLRNR